MKTEHNADQDETRVNVLVAMMFRQDDNPAPGEFLAWMSRLTWPDKAFCTEIVSLQPKTSRERVRRRAVDEGFDYILFVDSDLVGPDDAVEQLMTAHAELASGIVFGWDSPQRAAAFKVGDADQVFLATEDTSDVQVAPLCFCLVARAAFEALDFGYPQSENECPYWCEVRALGYRTVTVNGCLAKHYYSATDFWIIDRRKELEESTLFDCHIESPDGIIINNVRYRGLVRVSREMWEQLNELDRPYRNNPGSTSRRTYVAVPPFSGVPLRGTARQSIDWNKSPNLTPQVKEAPKLASFRLNWESAGASEMKKEKW